MRQPIATTSHSLLPSAVLLLGSLGCMQPGLAQSRPAGGPAFVGSTPGVVEKSTPAAKPRVAWRRDNAPASLTAQSIPPQAPTPGQQPPSQANPQSSTSTPTVVVPPVVATADSDYWIVSSRDCDPNKSPGVGSRCLTFFHRTSNKNLAPETHATFVASIQPDRPVCFVIHGSYNWWRDVLEESQKINRWIHASSPGTPVQVVFFTWPSDGNMPVIFPVDIAVLGRKSAAHGIYLADLVTQLPPEQRVSIVGHSHGARAGVAAMHLIGGGTTENGLALPAARNTPQHLRAVLIAAAIDHNWLNPGERYSKALFPPERVLLMGNSRDATLGVYPMRKGFGERALGKNGLGQDDRFVLGALGPKVVELDVAQFTDWHHSFSHYHERPELAAAATPFIFFNDESQAAAGPANGPAIGPPPSKGPSIGPIISPEPYKPAPMATPVLPKSKSPVSRQMSSDKPKADEIWVIKPKESHEPPATPVPRRKPVELEFERD